MSENFEDKPKWWNVPFFIILNVMCVSLVGSFVSEYKYIFIDKLAFAETTSIALLLIFAMPILMFVTWMVSIVYFRRHIKHKDNPKIQKTFNVLIILCGIGLFTPVLVGPLNSHYMTSQGYEKCVHPDTTTFTGTFSQHWAKTEVGCEVWELSEKDRQALKKKLLNEPLN